MTAIEIIPLGHDGRLCACCGDLFQDKSAPCSPRLCKRCLDHGNTLRDDGSVRHSFDGKMSFVRESDLHAKEVVAGNGEFFAARPDVLLTMQEAGRAATPMVREKIIRLAMDMSLPPTMVEKVVGNLVFKGLIYVGILPPPKDEEVDNFAPCPQLLFRSTESGDDMDRSLTRFTTMLPQAVLDGYLKYLAFHAGENGG